MWTISQVKENGKMNFKKNYWFCVIVSIILGLCSGGSSGYAGSSASRSASSEELFSEFSPAVIIAIVSVVGVAVVVGMAIDILLLNPLEVGCKRFFLNNRVEENTQMEALTFPFRRNWINIVLTLFIKDIFLFLWYMLFIIPGMIKSYSYRLVPYIMADNPDMQSMDAISLSRAMMKGNKWKAFLFDLSFFGWFFLTILTLGILGVFYVGPYKNCANAELYTAIKENYNPQGSSF